jgi:glutamine synthetase
MTTLAEYIWIDGTAPSKQLRSKTRVIAAGKIAPSTSFEDVDTIPLNVFPAWSADGSSTNQAEGHDSDIGLVPVRASRDPFRPGHFLVLCEVYSPNGKAHPTNTRAGLREVLDAGASKVDALFGFEQEYTFFAADGTRPLGFPSTGGFPGPQGPYYCAVGANNIFGRSTYETFMMRVLDAGLAIGGFNWEVMPGQAEFQTNAADALKSSDHLWLARWILQRVGEDTGVVVKFDAKPVKGDWNGAGMHTNFSTKAMREPGGMTAILAACEALGTKRQEHLDVYGHDYESRLTGHHETCSYKQFRFGVADRTSSIRIPRHVAAEGFGYFEDRRPNANADPYEIAARMLKTVCGLD